MGANRLREYFVFTKKERRGVLILLVLIILVNLLPYSSRLSYRTPDPAILEAFQQQVAILETKKTDTATTVELPQHIPSTPAGLFQFDPNTLNEAGWQRLGVPDKVIGTIINYRNKGGRFYKPNDLAKIYGLPTPIFERLRPYVMIKEALPTTQREDFKKEAETPAFSPPSPSRIDINRADSADWVRLPAIGTKLAARIVLFRERLGGFYGIQQLREVYGLSDSAFTVMEPYVTQSAFELRKININTAGYEELRAHPYINKQLAAAIVQYRRQHGSFKSLATLMQIHLLTDDVFRKLSPYLEL